VVEQAAKFDELSKFCLTFTKYSHCFKFKRGLRTDIKHGTSYLEISSFPMLVNCCRIYESDTKTRQTHWRQGRPQSPERNEFNNKKPY